MLDPAYLTALIAEHYPSWRVFFLQNDHQPMIGVLPTKTWTLFADRLQVDDVCYVGRPCDHYLLLQDLLIEHSCAMSDDQYLMGMIGYDSAASYLHAKIATKTEQPLVYFGHYKTVIRFGSDGISVSGDSDHLVSTALKTLLHAPLSVAQKIHLHPVWQRSDYQRAFERTQEYIKAGDCYQINLTQCYYQDTQTSLHVHLPRLFGKSRAPFAGYVKLGGFELLSLSPELFLHFDDGCIITKPIKGTRPRDSDVTQDEMLKEQLRISQKDISENLMIVDLLRNDLGKYAKIGTVSVPKKFAIESFSNVHHMVSTIHAQQKDNVHPLTVLFGSLPAGSITGAPKKRACQIISELEAHPRGAYCGSMGLFDARGNGKWNVLIRTLQKDCSGVELWAGGGITIKSDADSEYQECLDKVGAILEALVE